MNPTSEPNLDPIYAVVPDGAMPWEPLQYVFAIESEAIACADRLKARVFLTPRSSTVVGYAEEGSLIHDARPRLRHMGRGRWIRQ